MGLTSCSGESILANRYETVPVFHLTMQNHTMRIIEVDGTEVTPYEVDVLPVAVAQRYSLVVEAKTETDTNFAFMFMQEPLM